MKEIIKKILLYIVFALQLSISVFSYAQESIFNQWYPLPNDSLQGMFGGYVRALAIDPGNSQILYAGTKGGGVFRSNNRGEYWHEKNAGLGDKNILSFAINPVHNDTVYVGTENGIFFSADSGNTWKSTGLPNCQVNSIAIDPENTNIVYAATGKLYGSGGSKKGLWRSTNAGISWPPIPVTLEHQNVPVEVFTVLINNETGANKKIYVGTSNGIWISTTGIDWPDDSHDNDLMTERVYSLAFDPAKPYHIYAGTGRGVCYSTDYGDYWHHNEYQLKDKCIKCLSVDAQNIYAGTKNYGIFRKETSIYKKEWKQTDMLESEIYSIQIDPSKTDILYCSTPNDVYKSYDKWSNFHKIINGMTSPQITKLLINPSNPERFIAGTTNGGFLSIDGGWSWNQISSLPSKKILSLVIHPDRHNKIYAGIHSDWVYFSKDSGETWRKLDSVVGKDTLSVFSIAIGDENLSNSYVFVGAYDGIYRSINSNDNFRRVKVTVNPVLAVQFNSLNPEILYAGTSYGNFYISSDIGEVWNESSDGLPLYENINDIVISPIDSTIFVSTGNGLYYNSLNIDKPWMKIDDPWLFSSNILKVIVDGEHNGIVYAVVENMGVLRSYDFGQSWSLFNKNLEEYQSIVNFLSFQPDSTEIIYATTKGKGIFTFQAQAELSFEPGEVPFGDVLVNKQKTENVKLINNGELPLIISDISVENPSFSHELENSKINPNSDVDISIFFSPDTIMNIDEKFLVVTADEQNIVDSVRLSGIGKAAFMEFIDTTAHNFGDVRLQKKVFWNIELKNKGNHFFRFDTRFDEYPHIFEIEASSEKVEPGNSLPAVISFTPQMTKLYEDTLRFTSKDKDVFFGDSLIYLHGEGIVGPYIELSDLHHIFNPIRPGGSDEWTFFIYNKGSEDLDIYDIACQNLSVFTAEPNEGQIPIDDSLSITVTFSTEQDGNFNCQLIISNNAAHGDSIITLEGECIGDRPIIVISPKEINYDSVRVKKSAEDSFMVKNIGASELIINEIAGADSQTIQIDSFLNTVGVDDSIYVNVTYTPFDTVSLHNVLTIITNDALGDNKIILQGLGIAPLIEMPDTLRFGGLLQGQKIIRELLIQNSGTDTLRFKIDIQGEDANSFSCNKDSLYTLPHGNLIIIPITFGPTIPKRYSATLKLMNNKFFYGDTSVQLTGYCFFGPAIDIKPESFNFMQVPVGDKSSTIFKIYNRGAETLNITNISITPDTNFSAKLNSNQIEVGANTIMTVTFKPDTIREYISTLTIFCDAVFGDTTVELTGYGKAPIIEVYPLDNFPYFGETHPDSTIHGSFIIKNTGNDNLIISDIYIEPQDTIFELDSACEALNTLSPDSFFTCTINFTPQSPGEHDATFYIRSDALNDTLYSQYLQGKCSDLRPPVITHSKVDSIENSSSPIISVTVTDELSEIDRVLLQYRKGGMSDFSPPEIMNFIAPDSFWKTIPGEFSTTRGLEYKITAFDKPGNSSNSPAELYHSTRVFVTGEGETKTDSLGQPVAQPSGTEEDAYRLISVPLELDNPHPDDVLIDDLGTYDEYQWRFADCKYPEKAYPDCYVFLDNDSISHFTPGKAFFLIVKDANKVIDSGSGISLTTDKVYLIDLKQGWNLIGNPFNFPILYNQLFLLSAQEKLRLWTYAGSWDTLVTDVSTKIFPWEGYAIYNYVPFEKLIVYPNEDLIIGEEATRSLHKKSDQIDWKIQIIANCQKALDEINYVGVSSFANMNYDDNDLPEPPGIGYFVMVYMPHGDWGDRSTVYTTDIQSVSEEGNFWDFEVVTNISKSKVDLKFDGLDNVPQNFQVQLIDRSLNIAQYLNKSKSYSFLSGSQAISKKRFRLIVGTENFITDNNLGVSVIPDEYYLSQNFPNPFNPSTSIYYNLPVMDKVTVKIINVLGQVVKTLVDDETRMAGTHVLIWDGTDNQNCSVASGLYMCSMKSGNFKSVRKLLLLK